MADDGDLERWAKIIDGMGRNGPKESFITIPLADYKRLLQLVEFDDMLVICETCGAWLDRDDPATATTDDYNGCWKVAAGEDSNRCKSYRAIERS